MNSNPTKWPLVPLGEICYPKPSNAKIIKGTLKTVNDGTLFPAYSATGQDVFSEDFDFSEDGIVISAVGARCGKCFLATGKWRAIANTHVVFPHKDKVDVRFLWYLINNESFWVKGGTAQPFVKVKDSLKKQVIHPPLEEQKRIVSLLDQADALRRKRRESMELLDQYVQSVFMEMFGDPVINPKGWDAIELRELIDESRGISYGIVQRGEDVAGGITVVRIKDLLNDSFKENEMVKTASGIAKKYSRTFLQGGELLISIRGTIGRVSIAPEHARGWNISREIALIPLLDSANKQFTLHLFKSNPVHQRLERDVKGVAQSGINLKDLRKLSVIQPPRSLQEAFEKIIRNVNVIKVAMTDQERELENNFNALMQGAFSGAL